MYIYEIIQVLLFADLSSLAQKKPVTVRDIKVGPQGRLEISKLSLL